MAQFGIAQGALAPARFRMEAWCALLLSAVAFAGTSAARQSPRAPKPSGVESAILALDARRFKAMAEADLAALDRILGDDLTYTHTSGWTQSKSELMESLRSGKLRYLSIEPANEKVRDYGTTAVGTGRAAFKVRLEGKELNLQLRFIEVYVRRHGRWQLVAWQSTRLNP
jgi:Domain of unknown function (DUF4440)